MPIEGPVEPFAEVKIIDDSVPPYGSSFGSDVGISGYRVIVDDSKDDTVAFHAGISHIYNANTGALIHTIAPHWYQGGSFIWAVPPHIPALSGSLPSPSSIFPPVTLL